MTKIGEHERKLTTTNFYLMNLTEILKWNCYNDEHVWLSMTENQKYNYFYHNGQHEQVNMTEKLK